MGGGIGGGGIGRGGIGRAVLGGRLYTLYGTLYTIYSTQCICTLYNIACIGYVSYELCT